jgi:hypothetical protein
MKKFKKSGPKNGQKLRIAPHVISRNNIDGSVDVLKLGDQTDCFVIKGFAIHIWRRLEKKATLADLVSFSKKQGPLGAAESQKRVKSFVAELSRLGLIEA